MKVTISDMAWFERRELSPLQLQRLRAELTVVPSKAGDYPGEDPEPIPLYRDDGDLIGVARGWFLDSMRRQHDIVLDVSHGEPGLPSPLGFRGSLRPDQEIGLEEALAKLEAGSLGGIYRAPCGSGKCLSGRTAVVLADIGEMVRLDSLIGEAPLVVSLLPDGSIGGARASRVWASGEKPCMKMTLASGQWLEASRDHPVLGASGYVRMDSLAPGDLVATARSLPAPLSPSVFSDAEVLVAGLYLADGCNLHNGQAIYCKGSGELASLFEDAVVHVPGFAGFGKKSFEQGAWYVHPHGMLPWIRRLGLDKRSTEKRLPGELFGVPDRQLALLLRALWTDGYIGRGMELALSSEGLVDDVQAALHRFGVVSRKSFNPKRATAGGRLHDAWRLTIFDKENILRFADRVGVPFGSEARFDALVSRVSGVTSNTNWDVVPVGPNELREIRIGCPRGRGLMEMSSQTWMGRDRFRRAVDASGYDGPLARHARQDLVWERVVSVEPVGVLPVYDLTVPETGNVVANGVIVHNTVLACALLARLQAPALVIVHKEFLMSQWRERIAQFLPGASVGLVQQDVCDYAGRHIVLAMVHTLAARKFPSSFLRWPGIVCTDECFPSGTLVEGPGGLRRIEELEAGDPVETALGPGEVLGCTDRLVPADSMRLVSLAGGREFICTEDHPVLTPGGWERAGSLEGSMACTPEQIARLVFGRGGAEPVLQDLRARMRRLLWSEADPSAAIGIPHSICRQGPAEPSAGLAVARVSVPAPEDYVRLGLVPPGDSGSVQVHNLHVSPHPSYAVAGVLVHNCHRIAAQTWAPAASMFPCRYRIGFSATPRRRDGADNVFWYHLGGLLHASDVQRMQPKIRRVFTTFALVKTPSFNPGTAPRSTLIRILVANPARNRAIAREAVLAVKAGRKLLVLSERLTHLDRIQKLIGAMWDLSDGPVPSFGRYVGGRKEAELAEAARRQVILATNQFATEGLDIPELDTLFLTTPVSDVEQASGRILRPAPGKKDPVVVDFRDDRVPMFRKMADYREAAYARLVRSAP